MITLNTAYQSLNRAAFDINRQAATKSRTVAQLSTGVAVPEENSTEASVVYKLRGAVRRRESTEQGMLNALSFLDAQAGTLRHIHSALLRMDELASRMMDPTQGGSDPNTGQQSDQESYMAEFNKLADEIWDSREASFNGSNLFYVSGARTTLSVATGEDGRQSVDISQSDFSTEPTWRYLLGTTSPLTAPERDPATVYVSTAADVMDPTVMGSIGFQKLMEDVTQKLAANGAERSRLEFALAHARGQAAATEAAAGVMGDVDVAEALTSLTRAQVLAQSAIAIRTQANVLSDAAYHVLSRPVAPGW